MDSSVSSFDEENKNEWYFGNMSREDTNELLMAQSIGTFLVRDSSSIAGDLVLCVKEGSQTIAHYIINRRMIGEDMEVLKIGDKEFDRLSSLLQFYKDHLLDKTNLKTASKRVVARANWDFPGTDEEDLTFVADELLTVLIQRDDGWATAVNAQGREGVIPLNRVTLILPSADSVSSMESEHDSDLPTCPFVARVVRERNPNIYDTNQLRLKRGDLIVVLRCENTGLWYGEIKGSPRRHGYFPFSHVKPVDSSANRPS